MRFKPVPEPPADPAAVATARRAVPLVPGSEDDCCARLLDRTDLGDREAARTWLTFLRALGLAEVTDSGGFVRAGDSAVGPDGNLDRETLARAFRERVFGAREVLAVLAGADGPLSAGDAFDRFEAEVPEWERHRDPGRWREIWRERVERLLGWAVLLGLAERAEGGYRAA